MSWFRYRKYVPVAARRRQAASYGRDVAKKRGTPLAPVNIEGGKITTTFWGNAWCANLEQYSDFANRLPRGRTYVRNGSVIDLKISAGEIHALVSGSDIYTIKINIGRLTADRWQTLCDACAREVDSLFDLLQGRLSNGVMKRLTSPADGLFPRPQEIKMSCSCPDWADVCKHVAATMYGVGHRLDNSPELLFLLRGVDHHDLIRQATAAGSLQQSLNDVPVQSLGDADLGDLFGIELESSTTADGMAAASSAPDRPSGRRGRSAAKKPSTTKSKRASKVPEVSSETEPVSAKSIPPALPVAPPHVAPPHVAPPPFAQPPVPPAATRNAVASTRRGSTKRGVRTSSRTKPTDVAIEIQTSQETRRGGKRRAAAKTIMIEIPVSAPRASRRSSATRRKNPK